jgi:hypothetical protein
VFEATHGGSIKRHDTGWLVTNPDGGDRYWVPDSNVVMVTLG